MARFAAVLCLALGMLALAKGQIPTAEECEATFDLLGEDSLTTTFTPCAVGDSPSAACCGAISSTTAVSGGGQLAGCLCQQQVIDGFVAVLEANTLATAVGFDGARLNSVLSQCGADVVGSANCNVSPPPPPPEETPTVEVTTTPSEPTPSEEPTPSTTSESTFEVTTTPAPSSPVEAPPSLPTPPGKLPPQPRKTAPAKTAYAHGD